jgi:hypothetical protein
MGQVQGAERPLYRPPWHKCPVCGAVYGLSVAGSTAVQVDGRPGDLRIVRIRLSGGEGVCCEVGFRLARSVGVENPTKGE